MAIADLENRFAYHPPDHAKRDKHAAFRDHCKEVASWIDVHIPEGREQSLAMTKLEEVMFWGNAGIARQA